MQQFFYLVLFSILLVNPLAFFSVWLDKKRSAKGGERAPEVFFFLLASLFGSLGVFLGIFIFRHKTKKIYFPLGIGFLLIQQIFLVYLVYKNYLF